MVSSLILVIPQEVFRYMVQIRYGPDDETLQGKAMIRPPQNDQENSDNTEEYPDSFSDVTTNEDTEGDYQLAYKPYVDPVPHKTKQY